LSDGRLLDTGRDTVKNAVGYDLTGLIVGSEGTLGIVVGATLRLVPKPVNRSTMVVGFDSLEPAGVLPMVLAAKDVTPSMLEILDQATIAAVEAYTPMGLDLSKAAYVIAQSDEHDTARSLSLMAEAVGELGATEVHYTSDPVEEGMLIHARKVAYSALEALPGVALLDDVGVPLSMLPALLARIRTIALEFDTPTATFGHLGDGNLHPTLLFDPMSPVAVQNAKAAFRAIVESAIELGGTATGEHGVGTLKLQYVKDQTSPVGIDIHRRIKAALDPGYLMNPGKGIIN
jgi:glycolate oxidase